jgi:hypothetical protein
MYWNFVGIDGVIKNLLDMKQAILTYICMRNVFWRDDKLVLTAASVV